MAEIPEKLARVRAAMGDAVTGVRLRGVDWFAWATGGRSNVVVQAAETGVAEVLVTREVALVVTDRIEAARMRDEELPEGFTLFEHPWADAETREDFVRAACGGLVASDRPAPGERPLPDGLFASRLTLLPEEAARLRALCREASAAVSDTLLDAEPTWSERRLAGEAASRLWARGITPGVLLVAGEARLPRYRHPTPSGAALGERAMLVICGRRGGLWANLTRFVAFRDETDAERALYERVARVEAAALDATRPGATLGDVFAAVAGAYAREGHAGAELDHHQGGPTGYLPRELVARPGDPTPIAAGMAFAWNPSLPGAKIEDTVLLGPDGVEVLTEDPRWPAEAVAGRRRPGVLVRR